MRKTKYGKLSGKVLPPQMEIHNELLERLQYIQNIQHMIEDDYFEHTIYFTRAAGPLYDQYRNMDFEVIDIYFPNQTSTFPYLRLLHVREGNNSLELTVHITNFNMITKRRPTRFGKRKKNTFGRENPPPRKLKQEDEEVIPLEDQIIQRIRNVENQQRRQERQGRPRRRQPRQPRQQSEAERLLLEQFNDLQILDGLPMHPTQLRRLNRR